MCVFDRRGDLPRVNIDLVRGECSDVVRGPPGVVSFQNHLRQRTEFGAVEAQPKSLDQKMHDLAAVAVPEGEFSPLILGYLMSFHIHTSAQRLNKL